MLPPKTKKAYHHGNLRRDLVAATLEIISQRGPDQLTLRVVAERLGVTAAATYRHFASKEELLAAVAAEGFTMLLDDSRALMATAGRDPLARYETMAVAYLQFAIAHPEHFRIMYGPHVDFGRIAVPERRAAFLLLTRAIEACQAAGLAPAGRPYTIANQAWAYTHGLVTLYLDGLLHRSVDHAAMIHLARQIRMFLHPAQSGSSREAIPRRGRPRARRAPKAPPRGSATVSETPRTSPSKQRSPRTRRRAAR
jgi:AcrR family transcriptional regulator